jgi:YegS/Rv2252/BmrU family lipid kinase
MQIAHEAASRYELVVAVGGDGTVLEVAGGILSSAATRTALGIVPFGTGNDFARNSGIHNEAHAHDALMQGQTRFVDVIEARCLVEGKPAVRHALLFAGVGIIGESLKQTTTQVKRLFGQRFAYPVGMLRALWSYRSPFMRITCDGQSFEGRFLFAGVSNSETAGGGMKIAPGAQTDDGLLNVNLVASMGRWEALKQLRRVCKGQHTTHPSVRYLTALGLGVETESPMDVAADGDLIGHTPAQFRVLPKALEVRVPA